MSESDIIVSDNDQFIIEWIDSGKEPECPPNPAYPEGVDLDLSERAPAACKAELPYPARRCGIYLVKCKLCRVNLACTTAGRRDDPRSVKIACDF